jgi:hypothetical protein
MVNESSLVVTEPFQKYKSNLFAELIKKSADLVKNFGSPQENGNTWMYPIVSD